MNGHNELEVKGTLHLSTNEELYKLVDFLNRNLKEKNLIFGLAQKDNEMAVTIYET